jgi:hypothetical protein
MDSGEGDDLGVGSDGRFLVTAGRFRDHTSSLQPLNGGDFGIVAYCADGPSGGRSRTAHLQASACSAVQGRSDRRGCQWAGSRGASGSSTSKRTVLASTA